MKNRISAQILIALLAALSACRAENTTYATGFVRENFWRVPIGADARNVMDAVGLPLRAWVFYTAKAKFGRSRQIVPLTREAILAEVDSDEAYVVCYYSIPEKPNEDYIRVELYLGRGVLQKRLEASVED